MKAIVYHKYGFPEVLNLEEVRTPTPRDDEVLIKVHAVSLNSWDWDLLRGRPLIFRLLFGFPKPKYKILGCDIAGRVEAVGRNIKKFQPGDEVFGDLSGCGWGGFAEYACAQEKALAIKPAGMTFEQAAAIPQAGVLALQGIQDYGKVKKGYKVLLNGAGGGVGTFAIQIARSLGAEVTAVDRSEKLEFLRSLGADFVMDYTVEDFTKIGEQYDLILDVVGSRSIFDYNKALNTKGLYLMVGGKVSLLFQMLFLGSLMSKKAGKKMRILAHKPNKDLEHLKELFESGKVLPVIDSVYSLSEVPEALRHLGEGKALGKVVITL